MRKHSIFTKSIPLALGAALTAAGAFPAYAGTSQTMTQLCDRLSQSSNDNVVISPYSIRMALSMLAEGAEGNTKAQLEQFLENCAAMLELSEDTELDIANSFWLDQDFSPREDYTQLLKDQYDALVSTLDFSAEDAAATINGWVSDKTHGLIPSLIDGDISAMEAVLVNALYYNGQWQLPFEDDSILDGEFHGTDGDQPASLLNGYSDGWDYYETDQASGFKLYYEDGLQFIGILPAQEDAALADLDIDALLESNDDWCTQNVSLHYELPEFKTEYSESLADALTALGVTDIFSDACDLSGIAPGLAVNDVLHKTYIDVNRKGTEAAAVTGVVLEAMAMPDPEPQEIIYKEVILDRPFVFLIREPMSGELLFLGEIRNL